jgi:hypothetical protein
VARRGNLTVPYPSPQPGTWENRLLLDSRAQWSFGDSLSFTYSGRLNLRTGDGIPFPNHDDIRNDLREAFISWRPDQQSWLDIGRINVKSGAALGYNPTDFFRTRAVVEALTADPSVLREDRLGTLMVMGQRVWTGGSVSVAYAPKVTLPTAIYGNLSLPAIDPMLDRTNAADRLLVKGSVEMRPGLNPEFLLYHQDNRTQIGANLTLPLGQEMITYAEWTGGMRADLVHDALRYGVLTRTLPPAAMTLLPGDSANRFRNDVSVGFSYTPAGTNLTLNAEYHYHQAGLSAAQWRNWFDTGARLASVTGVASTLWYVRGYASDQQEPEVQHSAFLRLSWTDAFVRNLNLTGLAIVNAQDGSTLVQATADYYLSRSWTLGALFSGTIGDRRSEYGSLPQAGTALIRLIRYL